MSDQDLVERWLEDSPYFKCSDCGAVLDREEGYAIHVSGGTVIPYCEACQDALEGW